MKRFLFFSLFFGLYQDCILAILCELCSYPVDGHHIYFHCYTEADICMAENVRHTCQSQMTTEYQIPMVSIFWYLGTRYNFLSVSTNGFLRFFIFNVGWRSRAGWRGLWCQPIPWRSAAFTCNANGTWLALAPLYWWYLVNNGGASPLSTS